MVLGMQLTDLLRALSSGLKIPVIAILLLLAAATIIMLGTLIAELFTERMRRKVNLPRLVEEIRNRDLESTDIIKNSGLLKLQRQVLLEIVSHPELTANMREALARKLLYQEQARYNCITKITDLVARLGPMLGLLGTLIPLGPGLIALGQGDTYTLSTSLLTAFDTTVAGLSVAAVSYVISTIRKSWYENDMTTTESIAACLLERESGFE
ncbi:MotA/TolQ/ExbB proton channel family protein [Candidatus Formimonas warabiya]|uniref:MotA/TolQ/ExbB proton channel domain-containing protein n=1 Tax=Formimonas warabiya TaxID=1761012 RepID=A0A3G1KR11_FORW1|nr:MotA/TolQ/ExbB proton channel family protein [Candidatus Formimonas warabiya]ATW24909.1 hypothetical protein DCMF_09115 [Candidatus Formimonas warabiya]